MTGYRAHIYQSKAPEERIVQVNGKWIVVTDKPVWHWDVTGKLNGGPRMEVWRGSAYSWADAMKQFAAFVVRHSSAEAVREVL